jgi:hypothetical protein
MDAVGTANRMEPDALGVAVESRLRSTPELRELVASWGIDLANDDRIAGLMAELESNVEASIPDFDAFQAALRRAAAIADSGRYEITSRALLDEVIALGGNHRAILARLNRHPAAEQLPLIETVPILRGKVTSWRTPVDQAVLRKRPRDTPGFLNTLDRLQAIVPDLSARQAAEQLRRIAQRPDGYIVAPLLRLRQRVEARTADPKALANLNRLRALLGTVEGAVIACTRAQWTEAASALVDARWRLPPIERQILAALITAPCAEFEIGLRGWRARRQCALLREEIEAGWWDARELLTRLRHFVRHGAYIPTAAFALLVSARLSARRQESAYLRPRR